MCIDRNCESKHLSFVNFIEIRICSEYSIFIEEGGGGDPSPHLENDNNLLINLCYCSAHLLFLITEI